ncbi:hypothetical protein BH11PLA1_BH11PLA1_23280 [soil metagenome]
MTVRSHGEIDAEAVFSAAQAGEAWALRALWERNRRYLAVVILAHKPNSAEADDLLQEVAAAMIAKITTVRSEGALLPWLRMVALNAARLAGRKVAARPTQALSAGCDSEHAARGFPGAGSDPAAAAETAHDSAWMLGLLRRLPDDYREPLLLRCVHDMTYRQIAGVMGLPETTVETRIARGRRMLRELVTAAENAEESRKAAGKSPAESAPARIWTV